MLSIILWPVLVSCTLPTPHATLKRTTGDDVTRRGGEAAVLFDHDPIVLRDPNPETGDASGDPFGLQVAGLGDIDGDGYDDVAVTDAIGDLRQGYVYVFYGSRTGSDPDRWEQRLVSGEESFGSRVDGGDLNGDGFSDVLVSAPEAQNAYVFYGTSSGLPSAPGLTLDGSDLFAVELAVVGDVDDDGFEDVLINGPGIEEISVYMGSSSGLPSTSSQTIRLSDPDSQFFAPFGRTIRGVGDLNDDGYDDVAVLAEQLDGLTESTRISVMVFYGSSDGLSEADPTVLEAGEEDWEFGESFAGADIDGDGFSDLLIGNAPREEVTVYRGRSEGVRDEIAVTLTHDDGGAYSRGALARLGDVDGDGDDDVIIGAPDGGYAQAVTGDPMIDTITGSDGENLRDEAPEDFGHSVDGAGDVNGDGCPDAIVGGRFGPVLVYIASIDRDGDGAYGCGLVPDDCDDDDPDVFPEADEVVGDGIDNNCDGLEDCLEDRDGDGYHAGQVISSADLDCDDDGEGDPEDPGGDCNDDDPDIFPDADETVGDGIDSDCDGFEDCLEDRDGDGHHADEIISSADLDCDDPGEADRNDPGGDCNDDDPDVSPEADEIVADGIDSDCDGVEDCLEDRDGDGYRTDEIIPSVDLDCDDPEEAEPEDPGIDCDDDDPAVYPGAAEPEGSTLDLNCDGLQAEPDLVGGRFIGRSCSSAGGISGSVLLSILSMATVLYRRRRDDWTPSLVEEGR
ncbi:MAG: FG-GAP-like repeat-containing protein [Myxococcota bacterium]